MTNTGKIILECTLSSHEKGYSICKGSFGLIESKCVCPLTSVLVEKTKKKKSNFETLHTEIKSIIGIKDDRYINGFWSGFDTADYKNSHIEINNFSQDFRDGYSDGIEVFFYIKRKRNTCRKI